MTQLLTMTTTHIFPSQVDEDVVDGGAGMGHEGREEAPQQVAALHEGVVEGGVDEVGGGEEEEGDEEQGGQGGGHCQPHVLNSDLSH